MNSGTILTLSIYTLLNFKYNICFKDSQFVTGVILTVENGHSECILAACPILLL